MLTRPISRALRAATNATDGLSFAGQCPDSACEWYTQWTVAPGKTTNCDPAMRTMGVDCSSSPSTGSGKTDYPCTPGIAVPWCAPGTAPVKSPCGVFAGGYNSSSRDMLDLDGIPGATWSAGSIADVAFAVTANHGGGYAYRLCPVAGGDLSEACFQRGHLKFAGTMQRVLNGSGDELATIPARRLSTGTFPPGSEWTRNPLPQEQDIGPGVPGMPDVFGRGPFELNVMDQVVVPAELEPGHYVLSWRWDAEQTKQVWSHCGDVVVVAADADADADAATARAGAEAAEQRVAAAGSNPMPRNHVCTGASIGLDVADCNSWVDLYDALDGAHWPTAWAQGCDSVRLDPCGCDSTWEMKVICTATRDFAHITELYLLTSSAKGVLPASFVGLTHLKSLSMVGTQIAGSLPARMGEMQALEMIWLDHNPLLGGTVPSSLLQLPRLSVLELHRSNFSGVLPPLDYFHIPDCTLNELAFSCPLPHGAASCGAACRP